MKKSLPVAFGLLLLPLLLCLAFACGTSAFADSPAAVVLDSCDLGAGWSARSDSLNKREGMASLTMKQQNVWLEGVFFDVDTSALTQENSYLEFWFFIEDPAVFQGDGQIELTSVGVQDDANEIHWAAASVDWIAGWNHVSLPFAEGVISGTFDFGNIRYFRFYQFTDGEAEVWIDNIVVTEQPQTVDASLLGIPEGGIVREEGDRELTEADKQRIEEDFLEELRAANAVHGSDATWYALLWTSVGCLVAAAGLAAATAAIIIRRKRV